MSTPARKPPQAATAPELTAEVSGPHLDPSGRVVTVLLASAVEQDRLALEHIFGHFNGMLHCAEDLASALRVLREEVVAVLVCERDLPPDNWKAMLDELAGFPRPPLLIVSSRFADDQLWAEALNLGAYDVLATPFDPGEVTRVVGLACLHWTHQQEPGSQGPWPREKLAAAAG